MEKMDMHCRNEYLRVIRENYFKARTRKEKTQLLGEYCRNTGQSRNYVIRKIHKAGLIYSGPKQRKRRKEPYLSQVKTTLAKIWEIFDYTCEQRLKSILEVEMNRLRELGEIEIPDEVALKLRMMSSATIDRKLKHQREALAPLEVKGRTQARLLIGAKDSHKAYPTGHLQSWLCRGSPGCSLWLLKLGRICQYRKQNRGLLWLVGERGNHG